jgi:hypothetical protein
MYWLFKVDFVIGDEVGNIYKWDIRANKSEPFVNKLYFLMLIKLYFDLSLF